MSEHTSWTDPDDYHPWPPVPPYRNLQPPYNPLPPSPPTSNPAMPTNPYLKFTALQHEDYPGSGEQLGHLNNIAQSICQLVNQKEQTYRGSWKKRGGVGAFMMLARKWDRIEEITQKNHYDLFKAMSPEDETGQQGAIIEELRDLIGYLLLSLNEFIAFDHPIQAPTPPTPPWRRPGSNITPCHPASPIPPSPSE